MGPWGLVNDGWFLPDSLFTIFSSGQRNQVPYLAIANMGELTGPGLVIADTMIAGYLKLLGGQARSDARGYAAVFDRVPDNWRREGCVSAHGMELHYMFGSLDVREAWEAHAGGFALSGARSPLPFIHDVADPLIADPSAVRPFPRIIKILGGFHFSITGNTELYLPNTYDIVTS